MKNRLRKLSRNGRVSSRRVSTHGPFYFILSVGCRKTAASLLRYSEVGIRVIKEMLIGGRISTVYAKMGKRQYLILLYEQPFTPETTVRTVFILLDGRRFFVSFPSIGRILGVTDHLATPIEHSQNRVLRSVKRGIYMLFGAGFPTFVAKRETKRHFFRLYERPFVPRPKGDSIVVFLLSRKDLVADGGILLRRSNISKILSSAALREESTFSSAAPTLTYLGMGASKVQRFVSTFSTTRME